MAGRGLSGGSFSHLGARPGPPQPPGGGSASTGGAGSVGAPPSKPGVIPPHPLGEFREAFNNCDISLDDIVIVDLPVPGPERGYSCDITTVWPETAAEPFYGGGGWWGVDKRMGSQVTHSDVYQPCPGMWSRTSQSAQNYSKQGLCKAWVTEFRMLTPGGYPDDADHAAFVYMGSCIVNHALKDLQTILAFEEDRCERFRIYRQIWVSWWAKKVHHTALIHQGVMSYYKHISTKECLPGSLDSRYEFVPKPQPGALSVHTGPDVLAVAIEAPLFFSFVSAVRIATLLVADTTPSFGKTNYIAKLRPNYQHRVVNFVGSNRRSFDELSGVSPSLFKTVLPG